jgi:hypothetical protein
MDEKGALLDGQADLLRTQADLQSRLSSTLAEVCVRPAPFVYLYCLFHSFIHHSLMVHQISFSFKNALLRDQLEAVRRTSVPPATESADVIRARLEREYEARISALQVQVESLARPPEKPQGDDVGETVKAIMEDLYFQLCDYFTPKNDKEEVVYSFEDIQRGIKATLKKITLERLQG